MADYNLSYTGAQINQKLGQVKTDAELTTIADNAFQNSTVTTPNPNPVTGTGLSGYVSKYGKICCLTVNGQLTAAKSPWQAFFTLPTGFRPRDEIYHYGPDTLYVVNPNGSVYMSNSGAVGTWVQFSVCYICG